MADCQVQDVEATVLSGPGYKDIAFMKRGGRFSISMLLKGVLFILVGLACHLWPLLSLELMSIWVGVSFIVTGIASLVLFFVAGGFKVFPLWVLIESICDIFMGAVFVTHPLASAVAMGWLSGMGIVVAGFVISLSGVATFKANRSASLMLLVAGIAACLLGMLITMNPGVSLLKCITMFSVVYGVLLVVLSFKAPKVVDSLAGIAMETTR